MPAQRPYRGKLYTWLVITTLLLTDIFLTAGVPGLALPGALLSASVSRAAISQITVTTTADTSDGDTSSFDALAADPGADGKISLREAIEAANSTPPGDRLTIAFAIPESDIGYRDPDVWVIEPAVPLPPLIRGNITIDGSTQPGSDDHPSIILDGYYTAPQDESNGITINSAGNIIRRLSIIGFWNSGVLIDGPDANDNRIEGSTIGVSAYDSAAPENGYGVELRGGASQNLIGGDSPSERNIISGNYYYGVYIHGADTEENVVAGNWIGPGLDGLWVLSNEHGVAIEGGASQNLIGGDSPSERNIISGNYRYGVYIHGADTEENVVAGNWIGLGTDGVSELGNERGVVLDGGTTDNEIGPDNVISDNKIGVELTGGAHDNEIFGNIVGLGADGLTTSAVANDATTSLGNDDIGIAITGGAHNNQVGGTAAEQRNVIANNGTAPTDYGYGVYLIGSGTSNNRIQGNYIGVKRTGREIGGGNRSHGIYLGLGANNNLIGGDKRSAGNVIAYNGEDGIHIGSEANQVAYNYIGVGSDGSTPLGNQQNGVFVTGKANTIGPENVVAYNQRSGVNIEGAGNDSVIRENQLHDNDRSGVCLAGVSAVKVLGNTIFHNGRNTDGGDNCDVHGGVVVAYSSHSDISGNQIIENDSFGIRVIAGIANSILSNSISENRLAGIVLEQGANRDLPPPTIRLTKEAITGTGCANCKVEIFADSNDEGAYLIDSVAANSAGGFSLPYDLSQLPETNITATNTDPQGNTSPFAPPVRTDDIADEGQGGQVEPEKVFLPMVTR